MPKYYEFKVCGYYLYYTASCVIEAMHVHASDRKLTEAGSAKFFVMNNGDTTVERQGQLFDALVMDYMDAEHVDKVEASAKIKDLYEDDDTLCHDVFQVFGQNYFDSSSLATPVKKRRFY